jgi:hypothetical protein
LFFIAKDARKAHGASASHLLMLGDVIMFAATTDVLGEDKAKNDKEASVSRSHSSLKKGASLRTLSSSLEAYVRARQTAGKKLRKRHGQLQQDAHQSSSSSSSRAIEAAPLLLSASAQTALQAALADYVSRQVPRREEEKKAF